MNWKLQFFLKHDPEVQQEYDASTVPIPRKGDYVSVSLKNDRNIGTTVHNVVFDYEDCTVQVVLDF